MTGRHQIVAALYGLVGVASTQTLGAAVDVSRTTICVDSEAATAALEQALREHSASREVALLLTLAEESSGDVTIVILRAITGNGERVFERKF